MLNRNTQTLVSMQVLPMVNNAAECLRVAMGRMDEVKKVINDGMLNTNAPQEDMRILEATEEAMIKVATGIAEIAANFKQ